jgi:serine protease Do
LYRRNTDPFKEAVSIETARHLCQPGGIDKRKEDTVRAVTMSAIAACLFGVLISNAACTLRGSRQTPIVKIVREYAPAVVNIRTETIMDLKEYPEWGQYGEQLDLFLKDYFGEDYSEGTLKYKSVGSGVIVRKDGLIVTNAHVIQKASTIFVVLLDGTIVPATVIEISQADDLALIKTEPPYPFREIRFADIGELMIGETVIAIGNPLGLENSVTVGVISGKERSFTNPECEYACTGLLQTDASINPGNSGGALLNLDGELIGVNLAVVQDAQNIGFAIPVNKVKNLFNTIK